MAQDRLEKQLVAAIKDYCIDTGLDYRSNYSGRGMFGRQCIGVVCDNVVETLVDIIGYIHGRLEPMDEEYDSIWPFDEILYYLRCAKCDSMALRQILYFEKLREEEEEQ